ncbi:MAG TPA: XRE family transcriptional regulator [Candidatus Omnitrophica bacterium]|nr:XRE family transcriptional regulator [Candidatus Omnitrophota bacterium]
MYKKDLSMLRKNFGKKVRQLRKLLKLTQEELAHKANMDYKYLGAIERGEKNLTIENIGKIAQGLGVEPYELFLFHEENFKKEEEIVEDKIKDILKNIPFKKKKLVLKIIQLILKEN